jgi:hypothetical protein
VRIVRGHAISVMLEYQASAMNDGHSVGVGFLQERVKAHRFGAIRHKRSHARRIVRDVGRRHELAHVVESPAVMRRGAPIGERGAFHY